MDTLRIGKAVKFAAVAHDKAVRKGSGIPYIAHPVEVAMLLYSISNDEDLVIAGLLHDVVEDTPRTIEDIREAFGDRVATLVDEESEDKMTDIPKDQTWKIRKERALEHLKNASHDAKLICLCDKLSNMRESADEYAVMGDDMWLSFNQKDKNEQEWYYRSIAEVLSEFKDTEIWKEYNSLCDEVFGTK
ncbi:MAG: HD domain-containing protein [Lachnospiraceae bacterium]|nr:HD domain-containing protein [Lachnospiraceae bacterium]